MNGDSNEAPYHGSYGGKADVHEDNMLSPAYYIHTLQKRIKLVLSLLLLGIVIGVILVARTEPLYEAKAQMLFSVGPPSRRGEIVDKDYAGVGLSTIFEQQSYIFTQMELLKGRGLAEAVIKRLHLEDSEEFRSKPPGLLSKAIEGIKALVSRAIGSTKASDSEAQPTEAGTSGLIGAFVSRVGVERVGQTKNISGSRMIEVTFTGKDKTAIKKILNTILEVFKEQDLERRSKAVRKVLDWLRTEQKKVQLDIEDAEGRVQEYIEREKLAIVPESEGEADAVDAKKLGGLSEAIVEASARRIQAETLYRNLAELVAGNQALPTEGENAVIQELKKEYAQLETKRAALGERFGDKWPEMRDIDLEMAAIKAQIGQEREKIVEAANASYELAKQQEEELKRCLEEQKARTIELRRKGVMYRTLKREAEANEDSFEILLRHVKEASIAESIDRSQFSVVTPAYISGEKAIARARKMAFALVFLFFCGGVGLAILLERANPAMQTEEEVEDCLGIPLLGSLARIDKRTLKSNGGSVPVLVRDYPRSLYAEQFQRITANTLAQAFGDGGETLLITSMSPQEGKSLIAANLAASLAKVGKKVLLIDADMHQPSQHDIFACENNVGLAGVLKDGRRLEDGIVETTVPNLALMVAGGKETRGEVMPLQLERVHSLLDNLKKDFDITILDCAPVGVVADALSLSRIADNVLLVMKSGSVTKLMGLHVVRQLESVKANLVGAILNSVPPRRRGSRYYYYYHHPYRYYSYYGVDGEGGKVKKKKKRAK